ncbi:phage minor head protein [Aquimarina algiphila]|uniref:phage head morphogenesis protein n=1 Tax=Aquimarina algiphila TaxID=2047982 RepID=UPI002330B5E3|nr:phage minor head protein [Aquimarina algiphila]
MVEGELLESLQKDVFLFSKLKTHTQLFEASRLLLDNNGKIKPFSAFKKEFDKINSTYNETYLESEYEFATSSAQMADRWSKIRKGAILQYRTANDERVRASHAALHGITLPKNDPFWTYYYAPNGWRCRCIVVQVLADKYPLSDSKESMDKGKTATTQKGKDGKNRLEIFRFNPGQQKVIFPPKHPYNKVKGANNIKKS